MRPRCRPMVGDKLALSGFVLGHACDVRMAPHAHSRQRLSRTACLALRLGRLHPMVIVAMGHAGAGHTTARVRPRPARGQERPGLPPGRRIIVSGRGKAYAVVFAVLGRCWPPWILLPWTIDRSKLALPGAACAGCATGNEGRTCLYMGQDGDRSWAAGSGLACCLAPLRGPTNALACRSRRPTTRR